MTFILYLEDDGRLAQPIEIGNHIQLTPLDLFPATSVQQYVHEYHVFNLFTTLTCSSALGAVLFPPGMSQ